MSRNNIMSRLKAYRRRLNGSALEHDLTAYQQVLPKINHLKTELKKKSDDHLQLASQKLIRRARNNESEDGLLVEAFALVCEAIRRVLHLQPFDVQIIGALVMHERKLAEMQTGEGKTLTAVFPAYLNALSGKGVHVLTFNDYLAHRDAKWMGPVYEFLGLTVGVVQEGMNIQARQNAYRSDVTYLTAKEAGFDFLRDSLCYGQTDVVHRDFHFAIVDEADSILIDEARVPLIIAGAIDENVADPYRMAQIARGLDEKVDFEFDEYARNITVTEVGLDRVESALNCGNLYAPENMEVLTRLNCAMHAEYLLRRDVDYIVRDGKVELVDEFTGRVADKRRWPDGLQAAIEAKENIDIQSRGHILNSITLQHFLSLYPKLSGMTATAQSAEKEFVHFYDLRTVVIPPNRPCIREDKKDLIYQSTQDKSRALIQEIVEVHETKRPILVGTRSVEESAWLAEALDKLGVKCQVLNAKHDEFEAKIVAEAGRLGAVTISTNMAGRGTDIRLGGKDERERDRALALGGLYVVGTNKHQSERIDRQLRGRAGRQGDPGCSRFLISLEDDLFVRYRLQALLPSRYTIDRESGRIDDRFVWRELNRVQRIVEGQNLEIKKTLCSYSHLVEQQRRIVFEWRTEMSTDSVLDFYESNTPDRFQELASQVDKKRLEEASRFISINHLDRFWGHYLAEIADIREGVHLARLGGEKPVIVFHKSAIGVFEKLQKEMESEMVCSFDKLKVREGGLDLTDTGLKSPSATWTYLINDNPFENNLGVELIGNTGLQVGAGLLGLGPILVALYGLMQRFGRETKR